MTEKEKYFYIFHFVDGSSHEFERNEEDLTRRIRNDEKQRLKIDNVIINMDNVTKVIIETQSGRDEKQRKKKEESAKTLETFTQIRF